MNSKQSLTLLLTLLFLVSGCVRHKVETAEIPSTAAAFSDEGGGVAPPQWWRAFEDPRLDELVAQAMAGNKSIQGAWERLHAARAAARASGALRAPSVDGQLTLARRKSRVFGNELTDDVHTFGLTAAYEVDVWGRLSARAEAALLEASATRADGEALTLILTSRVASAYFSALEQHQQLAVLSSQEEVNRQLLEIIEARFANGAASAVDVYQQREQLAAVQTQIPPARARLATTEHLLATLLGEAPRQGLTTAGALPVLPPLPALGIPAEVLRNRPDIRAGLDRVTAQDHRLGAAIADRYPALRLSVGATADDLFSDWLWSLTSSILGPVFDAGRRKAEMDRNQAVLQQQILNLEQLCLDAIREVEDALVRESQQRDLLIRLEHQLELARAAYEASRARYLNGVGNFLTVLTALQSTQRTERNLLSARFQLISNRISLYQALGGTPWSDPINEDAP